MDRIGRYERSDGGSNPSGTTNGRVIKLALDLVLKTSGTERYGDRYLTLPLKGKIRAVWTKLGGFENRRP